MHHVGDNQNVLFANYCPLNISNYVLNPLQHLQGGQERQKPQKNLAADKMVNFNHNDYPYTGNQVTSTAGSGSLCFGAFKDYFQ